MSQISLEQYELSGKPVFRNPVPAQLYEDAIRFDSKSTIADSGALVAYSGSKTGRSPKDKRIVRAAESEGDIWWGTVNIALERRSFEINRERARDYLNTRPWLYCIDAFAGWDPQHRLKVAGVNSKTSVDISFEDGEVIILGTEYAGEMKKGVFTIMNYLMPKRGVLSMHCSATADRQSGSSSLLFGLSGTGKTTLSADPKRLLIGDDEHCWTDRGVFNIEGGCYAKTIDLTSETEPDIFQALHYGAVLENVVLDGENHHVNFKDTSITQNTRGAYPIEFIRNAKIPCVAGHPTDVIFLTCDAFGVLPPVSKLSPSQAMYHFISGYTAKVAGTEMGINEPQATFSPCFGGPFLVWHPSKYAELLATKMREHKANVWLVNTGWSGGAFGTGSRMKLALTRAIVDAIHSGKLATAATVRDPVFGFDIVSECPGVPGNVLQPRQAWKDAAAYDATAAKLAGLFKKNFEQYTASTSAEILAGGPA